MLSCSIRLSKEFWDCLTIRERIPKHKNTAHIIIQASATCYLIFRPVQIKPLTIKEDWLLSLLITIKLLYRPQNELVLLRKKNDIQVDSEAKYLCLGCNQSMRRYLS